MSSGGKKEKLFRRTANGRCINNRIENEWSDNLESKYFTAFGRFNYVTNIVNTLLHH